MSDGSPPEERRPSWVIPWRANGSRPPLFCPCGGDGDARVYHDLALALPADQPVYAFGLPPSAAFPSVEHLAAEYVEVVRAIQPEGVYHLCGHSLGGLVAYEMAALLVQGGAEVGLVALIDALHPAHKRQMSPAERMRFKATYLIDRVTKYARNLGRGRPDRALRDAAAAVYGRAKTLYTHVLRGVFRRLGQAPPEYIASDTLILTAAWHQYEAKDHGLPLVMFNAIERSPELRRDPTMGWGSFVSRPIAVHFVPGDHYTLVRPPHVQVLAQGLTSYLGGGVPPARVPEGTAAWR